MDWPAAPKTPAAEENRTKAVSSVSRVSSSRCRAASTLGRNTRSIRSGVRPVTMPSSVTPATCTTPVSGCRSGIAASSRDSAPRSATSQAATVTRAPCAASSASSSAMPSAPPPRRLTSSRFRTPCAVTRCRATCRPSRPDAPVTRTVPSAVNAGPDSPRATGVSVRARRGTSTAPPRTANCSSPEASSAGSARTEAGSRSRSIRTNRPGFSDCAERTRPQMAACAGSTSLSRSSSSRSFATTALAVRTASRASERRSSASHCRSSSSALCTVSWACATGWSPSGWTTTAARTTAGSSVSPSRSVRKATSSPESSRAACRPSSPPIRVHCPPDALAGAACAARGREVQSTR